MLLTGQVGVNQLSGPVGIVNVVNDTYDAAAPVGLVSCNLEYDEPWNLDFSQLRCDESAADSCIGWRKTCISSNRSSEKKKNFAGKKEKKW